MSQETLTKLECTKCKRVTYHTKKNKKTIKNRLELMKYCKFCRARTPHKETK